MAKYIMIARKVCNLLRNNSIPSTTITNINILPNPFNSLNMLPCTPENNVRSSSDSVMLRNLRMAVTPSYGQESNIYEAVKTSTCSSPLAGDPKRLRNCQDIRAEVLEKWNKTPKPDTQKEWIKNIVYNTLVCYLRPVYSCIYSLTHPKKLMGRVFMFAVFRDPARRTNDSDDRS